MKITVPKKEIKEHTLEMEGKSFVERPFKEFVDELSFTSITPGGGSVSAVSGALSAACISMVAGLTLGKKGYETFSSLMQEVSKRAEDLRRSLLELVDEDIDAFNEYLTALHLPESCEAEILMRLDTIEAAAKQITNIPLKTLRCCRELMALAEKVLRNGNKNAFADSFVAVSQANAAAEGAWLNIRINLSLVKDKSFNASVASESGILIDEISKTHKELFSYVRGSTILVKNKSGKKDINNGRVL